MKQIIIAALLGALSYSDVQAIVLTQKTEGVPDHAEAVAKNAGVEGIQDAQDNRAFITKQQPQEQQNARDARQTSDRFDKLAYQRIADEDKWEKQAEAKKPSAEELAKRLEKKIKDQIKARKEINDDIIQGLKVAGIKGRLADEKRWHDEYFARVKRQQIWNTQTYNDNERLRRFSLNRRATGVNNRLTDEQWAANMPAHILNGNFHRVWRPPHKYGFLQRRDEEQDEASEDQDNDEREEEQDEDNREDEQEEQSADEEEEPRQVRQLEQAPTSFAQQEAVPAALAQALSPAALAQAQAQAQAQIQAQAQTQAQAGRHDAHLHETEMRVDPPLTAEGKKSIAEAEHALEEAKVDYDHKKAKAQELELAFHAAARISKSARDERAKAEDRYYVAQKASRKASRYADNMQREAQSAAARQAAHDKYAEVVATSNKESTKRLMEKSEPIFKSQTSEPEMQYNAPVANATAAIQMQNAPVANATAAIQVQNAPVANATAAIQMQNAPVANVTAAIQVQNAPVANATAAIQVHNAPVNATVAAQAHAFNAPANATAAAN